MAGRVLLDTNAVIALFAGDRAIGRRKRTAERVFIPAPVLGELVYGALKSTRSRQNLEKIELLAQTCPVLSCDATTAWTCGEIKCRLHKLGELIPDNDLWIAAVAIQHDLTLVTRDQHFHRIADLRVEAW